MKRLRIIGIVVALLVMVSTFSFAEYDRDVVKTVMRDNVSLMGAVSKAAKQEDYLAAGQALMKLAEGAFAVKDYEPPKGTAEEWEETWEAFIVAAFKGIGACGEEDKRGLDDAIKELKKLNGQGHRDHR